MAAYLRSGKILTIFHPFKNLCKLFSNVSWGAFNEMPLETRLVERLKDLGIITLTEIQQKSLGPVLKGEDVIINAETGSGKTMCYLVPVVDRLLKKGSQGLATLVFVPNMDLGYQVADVFNKLCDPGLFAFPLHRNSQLQINDKYPVVISTPQTLMQYNIKTLSSIQTVIVDEADLIFSNGGKQFRNLLQSFQGCRFKTPYLETSLQFIFAAATLPRRGQRSVFQKILTQFPNINCIASANVHRYVPSLTNVDVFVKENTKLPQLLKCLNILNGDLPFENFEKFQDSDTCKKFAEIFRTEEGTADKNCRKFGVELNKQDQIKEIKVLVFANTVSMANNIYEFLNCPVGCSFKTNKRASQNSVAHQFQEDSIKTTALSNNEEVVTITGPTYLWQNKVGTLHKEMSKSERQDVLTKFRRDEIAVLVSTDLASRGLDISDISHVIQVDYAWNAADTLHRAGRTARAGSPGIVINFITDTDKDLWRAIKLTERAIGTAGFQEVFSRKRQFSRRIKKKINNIHR